MGDVRLRPGTPRVFVVLNPTARKQTLRALDMRATVDREEFFGFQHGEGRLEQIERLAAAYRAGDLPDYIARVRRLAQDAGDTGDLLTYRTFRPNCSSCPQDLSPDRQNFFSR